jgi:hypothetical protein
MWTAAIAAVIVIGILVYEYRLRRPDQLVLCESKGAIGFRTVRFYPRHLSLAIPGTTHLMELRIDGVARGSIPIQTKLAASVAPSRENIGALVRLGGWAADAVVKAAREFEALIQGLVKEYSEKHTVEDLSSEGLAAFLRDRIAPARERFGLEVVSLTVQSIDPTDRAIAEAMRQRESARILEQTETLNQKARVAATEAKLRADEQIGLAEHALELKRIDLKREEQERESLLSHKRVEDELKHSRMKLEFEKEEMALLKSNPEILLLTPQVARLAEASQSLRNARTVVSLSPGDLEQGSRLGGLLQQFIRGVVEGQKPRPGGSGESGT